MQLFENSIIHKPSLGSHEVSQKFWPDWFSGFDVYWIQRKTDRQANKVYIKIKTSDNLEKM